jgi:hypothetical protein
MGHAAPKEDEKTREPVAMHDASALDELVRLVKDRKDNPSTPGDFDRFEREALKEPPANPRRTADEAERVARAGRFRFRFGCLSP